MLPFLHTQVSEDSFSAFRKNVIKHLIELAKIAQDLFHLGKRVSEICAVLNHDVAVLMTEWDNFLVVLIVYIQFDMFPFRRRKGTWYKAPFVAYGFVHNVLLFVLLPLT